MRAREMTEQERQRLTAFVLAPLDDVISEFESEASESAVPPLVVFAHDELMGARRALTELLAQDDVDPGLPMPRIRPEEFLMTKIRVSACIIEDLLFKGLDVKIAHGIFWPHNGEFELHVAGSDVPREANTDVICTKYDNPGADPFTTVEIKGRILS